MKTHDTLFCIRKPRSKVRRSSELDTDGIRSTIVKTLELIFGQLKRRQIRQVALQRFKKECVRFENENVQIHYSTKFGF